jgi:hypothetical protein
MFFAPNVHHDGIDRIRAATVGLVQAAPNCVETPVLRLRTEDAIPILETQSMIE